MDQFGRLKNKIVHFTQNFKFNCMIVIIKLYYYKRNCKTYTAIENGLRDPIYFAANINHLQYMANLVPMYLYLLHISASGLM